MNEREKRFADEWLLKPNDEAAALKAGYTPGYARKRAYEIRQRKEVQEYINKRLEKIESDKIAGTKEILEYLTAVVRGETKEEIIIVEGSGQGLSTARVMEKHAGEKDRLKAADMLLKRLDVTSNDVENLTPLAEMLKYDNDQHN